MASNSVKGFSQLHFFVGSSVVESVTSTFFALLLLKDENKQKILPYGHDIGDSGLS